MSANTPRQEAGPAGPALVGRAVLALVLTVVFYVMAVVFVAVMIGLPVGRWATGNGFPLFIGIAMVVAGFSVLVSIIPRRQRFDAPGPRLDRADQPELFGLVEG